ncbi:hypothetical protein VIGAN_09047300 [Vigna angularis var. angularis]|uniref:Retrotransposon gag domain-containing protein n=1 Tax=Vigna angularis var. angularis TaxID=157739 RepID=A0A0S3SWH4_PHAAN|nr:hypothetical protein VIGAN_09047300 [Vigna angularis var. angularis]
MVTLRGTQIDWDSLRKATRRRFGREFLTYCCYYTTHHIIIMKESYVSRHRAFPLPAQIEAHAQTIQEQQEIQRKQQEEIAALRTPRPPPEISASNHQADNEGSHHGGPSEPAGGGRRGPNSLRLTNLLPFTEAIMQAPMPEKLPPVLERYDGSADPDNHLRNFIDAMAFYTDNDPVICRAFSLSLKDEALEWYHTLVRSGCSGMVSVE